jgi:hypothetical protein
VVTDQRVTDSSIGKLEVGVVKTHEKQNRNLILSVEPWKVVNRRFDASEVQRIHNFGYQRIDRTSKWTS